MQTESEPSQGEASPRLPAHSPLRPSQSGGSSGRSGGSGSGAGADTAAPRRRPPSPLARAFGRGCSPSLLGRASLMSPPAAATLGAGLHHTGSCGVCTPELGREDEPGCDVIASQASAGKQLFGIFKPKSERKVHSSLGVAFSGVDRRLQVQLLCTLL